MNLREGVKVTKKCLSNTLYRVPGIESSTLMQHPLHLVVFFHLLFQDRTTLANHTLPPYVSCNNSGAGLEIQDSEMNKAVTCR